MTDITDSWQWRLFYFDCGEVREAGRGNMSRRLLADGDTTDHHWVRLTCLLASLEPTERLDLLNRKYFYLLKRYRIMWTERKYLISVKEMPRIEDRDVSISNLTAPTEKSHYDCKVFVTGIRHSLYAGWTLSDKVQIRFLCLDHFIFRDYDLQQFKKYTD